MSDHLMDDFVNRCPVCGSTFADLAYDDGPVEYTTGMRMFIPPPRHWTVTCHKGHESIATEIRRTPEGVTFKLIPAPVGS